MPQQFYPPFIVIPMPLDKEGRGPELNPARVDKTIHEVWDSACQTVCVCDCAGLAFANQQYVTEIYEDNISVQVAGRQVVTLLVPKTIRREDLEQLALSKLGIEKNQVAKVIIVPNKLVNIVFRNRGFLETFFANNRW